MEPETPQHSSDLLVSSDFLVMPRHFLGGGEAKLIQQHESKAFNSSSLKRLKIRKYIQIIHLISPVEYKNMTRKWFSQIKLYSTKK